MAAPPGVPAQLKQLIYYHLDAGLFDNALFFATRFHAQDARNADALHLLALCNLRLGHYKAAHDLARPKSSTTLHLGCVYVFAQTSLALERYSVGAAALEKSRGLWGGREGWNKHSETTRRHLPDAAACYALLGKLYAAMRDNKKAIENFVEALKLNPFMWDAFTGLCDIGAVVRPDNIFAMTDAMLAVTHGEEKEKVVNNPFVVAANAPADDPFTVLGSKTTSEIPQPRWQNGGHKRTISGSAHPTVPAADPSAAPPRRSTRLQSVQTGAHQMLHGIRNLRGRSPTGQGRDPELKDRRDLRKVKATGTKGKTGSVGNVGRVVSGNRKPMAEASGEVNKPDTRQTSVASTLRHMESRPPTMAPVAPPPMPTFQDGPAPELAALKWLLDLLSQIGSGYRHLSRFECQEAIRAFELLPTAQRETPWVLAQIGKAHHERSNWAEAEKVFLRIRERQPSYVEDMDTFSTVLWHQKKEVQLAYLASTLSNEDRLAPQSWVALGNAFSLQGDHDQAIKMFSRATQLDPKFAYAYTLQGHEHLANEELDKAFLAFRLAISANNRHYNGWYGLGRAYEMQHKFSFAEQHYRAAFAINPKNDLLAMKIGSMLDRLKKPDAALASYTRALEINPTAVHARTKRADMLYKTGNITEALKEYLAVKDYLPVDAMTHLHIGQCYKRLRNRRMALKFFGLCASLDPMAARWVKDAMEGWGNAEDDDGGDGWSSEAV